MSYVVNRPKKEPMYIRCRFCKRKAFIYGSGDGALDSAFCMHCRKNFRVSVSPAHHA